MSRAARTISQSGVYHIVFRGVNQQNLFEEKADFGAIWGRTFFEPFGDVEPFGDEPFGDVHFLVLFFKVV